MKEQSYLTEEQLINLLKSSNIENYINESSERIKYILNNFDLKIIFDNVNLSNYNIIYREINYINEEDLKYLINKNKLRGIEECKFICSNNEYVKLIIKSGYNDIFNYLSLNQVDDEILEIIDCNVVLEKDTGNLSKLLKSEKIFPVFSRRITGNLKYLLLEKIGMENITEKMVLFCLLDGMKFPADTDLCSKECYEKIKKYYNLTIDGIKKALEYGYKCSKYTVKFKKRGVELFIDYNQPEIIDYNEKNLSIDIIKKAIFKGHKVDDNLIRLIRFYGGTSYLIGLIRECYERKCMEYCEFWLIYDNGTLEGIVNTLLEVYKNDLPVKNYLLFKKKYPFRIKKIEEIYEYFDDEGPNNKLYEFSLFDWDLFSCLYNNGELLNHYQNDLIICNYIRYYEKYQYSLNIKNLEEIYECFNEMGPTHKLALLILLNVNARELISSNNELLQSLTSKEKAYFEFLKEIKFDNRLNFNSFEIEEYFDSLGLTDKGVEHILNDYDIFYSMNQESFKRYYENNYNISVFQPLLKQMDNCYYYLIKFLSNTLNIKPPINEDNIKDINKLYCLDVLEPAKMMEIIKYIFYSDKETKDELSKIMYNNEFEILIKLFCKLSINQNIEDLRKMVNNFNDYKELCINMYNESEFNESEKAILYSILINGDISARKIIKNREDLNNYSKIKYDKNNEIINTSDITFIKSMIFSNLFNIDLTQVRKILDKYGEDIHFSVLKDNIHDDKLKEVLNEYDAIIGFISSIYNSQDLDSLKIIASKINENYKNDNLDMFFNLWSNFSKMDSDIMKICGEEINEKITNFSELLNTKEEDIPIIDGEKAFILSSVNVGEDFEYDGVKINKGTNVKMIELNGLPFVTLGHVLNAFGSGGKLSDFNHPRLIGRTHLCLTGIDDNYYNLVNRDDRGIDYVQVIFDNLPSESLVIASSKDVGSRTEDNSLPVMSWYSGTYQPIRKIITETFHGENGYNEYVYYRQYSDKMISLRPSAILIRGKSPTESEIQAAAYLNVPLVKINKEKYPIKTKEEMKIRDKELEIFYKNLYEKRKQKSNEKKVIELQSLRQQIMGLYDEEKYIGRKIG